LNITQRYNFSPRTLPMWQCGPPLLFKFFYFLKIN
jgi:hypothetical protein